MKRDLAPAISLLILVLMVVLIAGASVFLLLSRPTVTTIQVVPPRATDTPAPTSTPAPVTVYVTGAVQNPNMLISLPFGSRIGDAVEAAGGALPSADLERVNLAAVVRDGDQIHIYEQVSAVQGGEAAAPPNDASTDFAPPTSNAPHLVNVNTATVELDTLPGIGPAIAQRIIDYREANGRFTLLESLLDVSGIGPASIAKLDGLVVFD